MTVDAEDVEVELLLEGIHRRYGYDFRGYSSVATWRRIRTVRARFGFSSVSELQHRVLHDPEFFAIFLGTFNVSVTELFREPRAFAAVRDEVFPFLRSFSQVKIWHAGCASGEEVVSMALLLRQAGLLERTRLYGTDINPAALARARAGVVSSQAVADAEDTWRGLGGEGALVDHFEVVEEGLRVADGIRRRMVFADHNLSEDRAFGEMQLVVCRNTLIYFGEELQDRAIALFTESLGPLGYLCIGERESLVRSSHRHRFQGTRPHIALFRKSSAADG